MHLSLASILLVIMCSDIHIQETERIMYIVFIQTSCSHLCGTVSACLVTSDLLSSSWFGNVEKTGYNLLLIKIIYWAYCMCCFVLVSAYKDIVIAIVRGCSGM